MSELSELKTQIIWIEENIDHDVEMDMEAHDFFKRKFGCEISPTKISINGYFNSYNDFSISIQVIENKLKKKDNHNHLMLMQIGNVAIKDIMVDIYVKFLCLINIAHKSKSTKTVTGIELENTYARVISDMSKILKNPPYVNKIPVRSYLIDHIQEKRKLFKNILKILGQ